MIITAKFASMCPCCSVRISIGSKVEWTKGSKAVHAACAGKTATTAAATTAPSRRYYGGSRYATGAGAAASVAGYSSWCTDRADCGCYDCAS